MRLHFIVNERAGNGRSARVFALIQQTLSSPYDVHKTMAPRHATAIVEQIASIPGEHVCIVIGGDGTIHEAIQGAVGKSHIIIGVMNGGSGNDFGRGFGAFETARDIEQFLQMPITTIEDAGVLTKADTCYFMNNIGYGVDAKIVYEVNRSPLKKLLNRLKLGRLIYPYILVQEVLKFKPFDVVVEYEGKKQLHKGVWVTTVSNQPFIGGGMKISPHSMSNDGRLELTIVENISALKIVLVFGTLFSGKHLMFKKNVKQLSAKSFKMTYSKAVQGHADGEDIGVSDAPVMVTVAPEGFRLARKMLD